MRVRSSIPRRCGIERRKFDYDAYAPERRSGVDRRSGIDRRDLESSIDVDFKGINNASS